MATPRSDGPASLPKGSSRSPKGLPQAALTALASTLGATVEEVQTLPTAQLRKWLDHPDTIAEICALRTSARAVPPAGYAPPATSSLQRFRDLRRQTLHSRLSDRPEVMNGLLGWIEELERSEDVARAVVRQSSPPSRRPSPRVPLRDISTPDLVLMRNARAFKSTPPPPRSLLGRLASGLGGLFQRSRGKKAAALPPRR